ncbi:hypothetical protein D3C78_1003840 [compost metagenome]
MVKLFQPMFGLLMGDRMVQRGGQEQQDHAAAIKTVASDGRYVSAGVYRLNQQQYQADNTKNQPYTVTDAVSDFFRPRIGRGGHFFSTGFHYARFSHCTQPLKTANIVRNYRKAA